MNLFRLDNDPETAASYHRDKHVMSGIQESALMLSTVLRQHGRDDDFLYGSTHQSHPVTQWVGEARQNFAWTYDYCEALYHEKVERWGGGHASYTECVSEMPREPDCIPAGETEPPIVGGATEFDTDDPVEAYRWHYITSVDPKTEYKNAEPPKWLVVGKPYVVAEAEVDEDADSDSDSEADSDEDESESEGRIRGSMRFVCHEHGEVETVNVNGYTLGHLTGVNAPNERDLEGIDFVFGTEDGEVVIEDADGATGYLSKFSDWRKKLTEAVVERADVLDRQCPRCGQPTWCLEDDEPVPEP